MYPTTLALLAVAIAAVYAADKQGTTIDWSKTNMKKTDPMLAATDGFVVKACNNVIQTNYEAMASFVYDLINAQYKQYYWNVVVFEAKYDFGSKIWANQAYLGTCNGNSYFVWGNLRTNVKG